MKSSIPWFKKSVVYQVYPRSFKDSNQDGIGDIRGIVEKLDYLKDLGIDVVWLSPVYESPNDDNGYDISDYRSILSDFGTMEDFMILIDELHKRDIKLVMDLVANHTSDEHPWFIQSKSSKNNPKRNYYIWKQGKHNNQKEPNNWTSFFTGKAWTYDATTEEYYLHLFSKKQPDLNWENPLVREEIKDILRFWLNLGVDGFRCDVINIISKDQRFRNGIPKIALTGSEYYLNGPNVHKYLQELYTDVLSNYDCFTVGETVFVSTKEASKYVGEHRNELNMIFHFEHMAVDTINNKWFLRPYRIKRLKRVLSKWQNDLSGLKYKQDGSGWNALYFENHDQPRSVTRFGNDSTYWKESAKMLATMLYFQQGTPYIYQGQEIGMTNAHFTDLSQYQDIETHNIYKLGRSLLRFSHKTMMRKIKYMSRDNARTPMQWDNSEYAGFSQTLPWIEVNPNKDNINVDNQLNDQDSIFKYYQKIIQIRKQHDVVILGKFEEHFKTNPHIYCYSRRLNHDHLLILCNGTNKNRRITIKKLVNPAEYHCILSNYTNVNIQEVINLRPYEAIVLMKN